MEALSPEVSDADVEDVRTIGRNGTGHGVGRSSHASACVISTDDSLCAFPNWSPVFTASVSEGSISSAGRVRTGLGILAVSPQTRATVVAIKTYMKSVHTRRPSLFGATHQTQSRQPTEASNGLQPRSCVHSAVGVEGTFQRCKQRLWSERVAQMRAVRAFEAIYQLCRS